VNFKDVIDLDVARERRERGAPPRMPAKATWPHRCRTCGHSLGRWQVLTTDAGLAPVIERGPCRFESFEDRHYVRVVCRGCGRNERVRLADYQAAFGSTIYV
jgi:hypothetical protein